MASIVIATVPATGHVTPLLPIARALCQRGERVRWMSGKNHAARIRATGAEFVPYPEMQDIDEAQLDDAYPARKKLKGLAALKHDIKHIFFDHGLVMLRDLAQLAAREPFDLLLSDIAYLGTQLYHERTRVPLVVVNVSPLTLGGRDVAPFGFALQPSSTALGRLRNRALHAAFQGALFRDVNQYFHKIRLQAGLPARGWFLDTHERASLLLQPTVPSFEYPRSDLPDNVHFIGLLPPETNGELKLPGWLSELDPSVPVVHVTQGTIANRTPHLMLPALRGLADERVQVVLTTGGRSLSELGIASVPKNAYVASYVPYTALLPKVHAMLSNGGYGGVQQGLSHGIPVAVAGATEDKPEVAARLVYSGAGLDLKTGAPNPKQVRAAVRSLLDDPTIRARAAALSAEYARYDALALTLSHIDTLLGRAHNDDYRARNTMSSGSSL